MQTFSVVKEFDVIEDISFNHFHCSIFPSQNTLSPRNCNIYIIVHHEIEVFFTSEQSWKNDIGRWIGERLSELQLEGSFRLAYNASMFVKEGLGCQLTFTKLVDTSPESGLMFRPLSPALETKLFLIWNKYQTFTPIAERFLAQIKKSFSC